MDAVGGRLRGGPGSSHVTLGGQRVSLDDDPTEPDTLEGADGRAAWAERRPDAWDGWMRGNPTDRSRTLTARELLRGNSSQLSLGGDEDRAGPCAPDCLRYPRALDPDYRPGYRAARKYLTRASAAHWADRDQGGERVGSGAQLVLVTGRAGRPSAQDDRRKNNWQKQGGVITLRSWQWEIVRLFFMPN